MSIELEDTITAIASPPGPAERGIIRISGPEAMLIVSRMFASAESGNQWQLSRLPRRWPGKVNISVFCRAVPAALLFWPTRRSYTGQMMAELHLPGSEPILEAVLEDVCRYGARMARRGEFTMRAFLAGRMDLLQAEAVHGVIEATDHDELQRALGQLGGGITGRLRTLREDLISLLGDLEAGLDFVDEDIEFVSREEICRRLTQARNLIQGLVEDSSARLPAGHRRRIVLAGLPNAGKSTLFNALTGARNAIVSPIAGTTRDYVSAIMSLGHLSVELIDTAGWEETADVIMHQAQVFRQEQVEAADLLVWCRAADLTAEQRQSDEDLRQRMTRSDADVLTVRTRCDLVPAEVPADARECVVSAANGTGLEELRNQLAAALGSANRARTELLGTSAVRCRESLTRSLACLEHALEAASRALGDELISMELRQTLRELQVVLGEVYTDDLLDHIFSHFCIGK
jgi:tRNA modification GTPase